VEIPVELASFLMVANRLVDLKNKLAISHWYKEKVYIGEVRTDQSCPS